MQHRTQSICPTRAKNFFYWSPHYFPSNEWPLGLLEGLIYTVGIVCTICQVCKHDFLNNAIYLKEYSTRLREIWCCSILRNLAYLLISFVDLDSKCPLEYFSSIFQIIDIWYFTLPLIWILIFSFKANVFLWVTE